jgi:hypothetical protein
MASLHSTFMRIAYPALVASAVAPVPYPPGPSMSMAAHRTVAIGAATTIIALVIRHTPASETVAMAPTANKRHIIPVVLIALAADWVVILAATWWVPELLGCFAALIRTGGCLSSLNFSRAFGLVLSLSFGFTLSQD